MSGHGQISIQPINLDTLPRKEEGSKVVLISQNWSDPALGGGVTATYNLLSQYQSGQFTNVQAVWIDNGSVYQPVTLTVPETGQIIRVPGLTQGMYPIASWSAPIFTLTIGSITNAPPALAAVTTTRLMFFNTPQRYYVQSSPPVLSITQFTSAGFAGPGLPAQLLTRVGFPASQYISLKGFQLALAMTGGTWGGNQPVTVTLQLNSNTIWADIFNVTPASFGLVYSGQVMFPAPIAPTSSFDLYTLFVSALQPGGTIIYEMTLYYDVITIN